MLDWTEQFNSPQMWLFDLCGGSLPQNAIFIGHPVLKLSPWGGTSVTQLPKGMDGKWGKQATNEKNLKGKIEE